MAAKRDSKTQPLHNNCNNISLLFIVVLLYQPYVDFAGISPTPHELSSPPSACSAAAEGEGDNKRLSVDL